MYSFPSPSFGNQYYLNRPVARSLDLCDAGLRPFGPSLFRIGVTYRNRSKGSFLEIPRMSVSDMAVSFQILTYPKYLLQALFFGAGRDLFVGVALLGVALVCLASLFLVT